MTPSSYVSACERFRDLYRSPGHETYTPRRGSCRSAFFWVAYYGTVGGQRRYVCAPPSSLLTSPFPSALPQDLLCQRLCLGARPSWPLLSRRDACAPRMKPGTPVEMH